MLNELQRRFFHADPGKEHFAKAINIEMGGGGTVFLKNLDFHRGPTLLQEIVDTTSTTDNLIPNRCYTILDSVPNQM